MDDPIFSTLKHEMARDADSLGTQNVFGLRIMFVSETDESTTVIAPWVTHLADKASYLAHIITHDSHDGAAVLAGWLATGDMELPEGHIWEPLMVRVIKLHVVSSDEEIPPNN